MALFDGEQQMNKELEYRLDISEEHAQILWDALELYTRIHMGQWKECVDNSLVPACLTTEARRALNSLAFEFKARPSRTGYHGILSDTLVGKPRTAFDMEQVIRHCLSWSRRPHGEIGVHFDEPMHWSKEIPLLKMKKIPKEENKDIVEPIRCYDYRDFLLSLPAAPMIHKERYKK